MNFEQRIQTFDILKDKLSHFLQMRLNFLQENSFDDALQKAILLQSVTNKWFPEFFIIKSIEAIVSMLQTSELQRFAHYYHGKFAQKNPKIETVLVISAGNIPLAGFHDFFSVLVSGNRYLGKLSTNDNLILPEIAKMLIEIDPYYSDKIIFTENVKMSQKMNGITFDKVIMTGSNNSARYFEYYFSNYPKILRKNRNSFAILTGNENEMDLISLGDDIFFYFGLGCRSISKIYVPKNYNFASLIEILSKNDTILNSHNAYLDNLEYQKTIHLMNKVPFFDAGILILVENNELSSPISVLNYEYYETLESLNFNIEIQKDDIQCIACDIESVSQVINEEFSTSLIPFGQTQYPNLLQYPDQIDIVKFCIS
jgi:hypothetical protein